MSDEDHSHKHYLHYEDNDGDSLLLSTCTNCDPLERVLFISINRDDDNVTTGVAVTHPEVAMRMGRALIGWAQSRLAANN